MGATSLGAGQDEGGMAVCNGKGWAQRVTTYRIYWGTAPGSIWPVRLESPRSTLLWRIMLSCARDNINDTLFSLYCQCQQQGSVPVLYSGTVWQGDASPARAAAEEQTLEFLFRSRCSVDPIRHEPSVPRGSFPIFLIFLFCVWLAQATLGRVRHGKDKGKKYTMGI